MAMTSLPTQDRLRKLLDYDPETGSLIWKLKTPDDFVDGKRSRETYAKVWNASVAGKPALSSCKANGYLCGSIDNLQVLQHRVIWKWMTGNEPEHIDHINGNPSDNKWDNLRSVSRHMNMRNMKRSTANRSGRTGVCLIRGKWFATGTRFTKTFILGRFDTFEDAVACREKWELSQKFHSNHGRVR